MMRHYTKRKGKKKKKQVWLSFYFQSVTYIINIINGRNMSDHKEPPMKLIFYLTISDIGKCCLLLYIKRTNAIILLFLVRLTLRLL